MASTYSILRNNNFIFEKVKGHTGAKDWNSEVDKLAVEARKQI